MTPKTKKIEAIPYDPEWPKLFQGESALIKKTLGGNCVAVHHVGSTSVPGLVAKPIIDIITVVKDREQSVSHFESIGYTYKGEMNIPFRHYFTKKSGPSVNLHVYTEGNSEILLNLIFRDYLRTHPEAIRDYADLKMYLLTQETSFQKQRSEFSGYTLGKDSFIRKILGQAGFKGIRLMHCTHDQEWNTYHRIRMEQIFNPVSVPYDPSHPTLSLENHYHFVLYRGTDIVCTAHVEFLKDSEGVLRSLATDEPYKEQGYEACMMDLLEKWIKNQGRLMTFP